MLSKAIILRVAIWMHLLDLLLHYWDRKSILEISTRPIAVDACTEAPLKGIFARVCVEIVTKPLVLGVSLGSLEELDWQELLYKNVKSVLLPIWYFRPLLG